MLIVMVSTHFYSPIGLFDFTGDTGARTAGYSFNLCCTHMLLSISDVHAFIIREITVPYGRIRVGLAAPHD